MKRIAATLALVVLALVACGKDDAGPQPEPLGAAGTSEERCPKIEGDAIIDWVEFFKHNGITYVMDWDSPKGAVDESDVGDVYAEVECKISDRVSDPHYETRDGDAAFLDIGTKFHVMKGYAPTFRLLAKSTDGKWTIYEADTSPAARTGADLLDIDGKVTYIGVNSYEDGISEIGAIHDRDDVESMVRMALQAPVDQDDGSVYGGEDRQVFVAFHMKDGTLVNRAFFIESNFLSRGIIVPARFSEMVKSAIEK
jgi:hypothetical protein